VKIGVTKRPIIRDASAEAVYQTDAFAGTRRRGGTFFILALLIFTILFFLVFPDFEKKCEINNNLYRQNTPEEGLKELLFAILHHSTCKYFFLMYTKIV
jgi:hypothetical protein